MPIWTDKHPVNECVVAENQWFPYRAFTAADPSPGTKYPLCCHGFDKIKLGVVMGGFTTVGLELQEKDAEGNFVPREPTIDISGISEDGVYELPVTSGTVNIRVASVIGAGNCELSIFGVPRS